MLCMDPGNCKEWKDAPGDSPQFSADAATQAPWLICHSVDSNQGNRHPPRRLKAEKGNKIQVVYFEMWAGVILEACLASHLSHWFLRMATWAPFGSTPVHPTPVISSFSLHFLSRPISSRSDLRISTGCASLAQASTTQRKKLINVRNVQWEDYVPIMKIDVIVVCNFRPRRLFSSQERKPARRCWKVQPCSQRHSAIPSKAGVLRKPRQLEDPVGSHPPELRNVTDMTDISL